MLLDDKTKRPGVKAVSPKSKRKGRADHALDLHDFAPGVLGIEDAPPSPLPRMVLRGVLVLVCVMLVWAAFGRLDIVAVADGKLVPISYLKIVQPLEGGIVREISVQEGEHVIAGQVLARMDANVSDADSKTIQNELQRKTLELRRIEAELAGVPFRKEASDPPQLYANIEAEYYANRRALEDALAQERATLDKTRKELAATLEVQHKLEQTLPTYRAQEEAYAKLGKIGFAGNLMVLEKQRDRIENEQDLRAQEFTAQSLQASITQSEQRLAQINSNYRQKLQQDKVETYADYQKLQQEWAKQEHRNSLLELRAPQAGVVKDLATHTAGSVLSPGSVLMTLVPINESLQAEVWVKNEDIGFVHKGQPVKIKLAAFQFQKYGMVDGEVIQVSADANDSNTNAAKQQREGSRNGEVALDYRTLVRLKTQTLDTETEQMPLSPGMQIAAEIKLSDQTVLEYLLSPVRKAFHEAGRER